MGIDATIGIKANRLNASILYRQKHLYGITTVSGSFSIPIRIYNPFPPFVTKCHFQIIDGMVLPEIKGVFSHTFRLIR
jgi:hypothetical protein